MSWVFEHSNSKGTQRLVLLALADRANDYDEAWPSVARLAAAARTSTRSVQRALDGLVKSGELHLVPGGARAAAARSGVHAPRGDRTPNAYRMTRKARGDNAAENGVTRGDKLSPRPRHGVTPTTPRGDTHGAHGVTPVSPETKGEPSMNPKGSPSPAVAARPPREPIPLEAATAGRVAIQALREAAQGAV